MRALVMSNCSYPAYTAYMQKMFPSWDVRGVFLPQAATWVAEKHPAFLEFVDQIDVFIGMTGEEPLNSLVKPGVQRVLLPYFVYQGYHPDTIWLHGVPSPLQNGVLHSPIAASAFLLGKSTAEARALFNPAHFERLGYFDKLAADRARVIAMFAETAGLEIADLFVEWSQQGNFMHTPNHPKPPVFFDIIHAGMLRAGFGDQMDMDLMRQTRAALDDDLGRGVLWPMYPDLAARAGLAQGNYDWRTPEPAGGIRFGLDDMLARSWEIYSKHSARRGHMIALLGGMEKVTAYGEM